MYSLIVAFFLLALTFSFFCSLWEAVLLSVTPSHARLQSQQGTRVGRYLEDFKANIDRPLAAILTLNTIAHTVGAIGVGAQAAVIWEQANPWITRVVVPAVMTIAILILSEIVPKTIGALYWQRLVTFTVHSLRLLTTVLAPFVWLSQYITRGLRRDTNQPILTRTDFLAMAELGTEEGVLEAGESEMIGHLIRFQAIQSRDVMTPRTVVTVASQNEPIADYYTKARSHSFSRIPVHDESKDHITGYVMKDDLFAAMVEGRGSQPMAALRREIVAVDESFAITGLFEELRKRQEHLAVVLDEFGGMAGIVTMEDVIETLLGLEIVDETDSAVDMRELARRHRVRRANALGLLDAPAASSDGESVNESSWRG
ncbi:MAG: hemolysin family protein [Gemmatimonadota bacterium]|nr:hemolysin family protein [Gemmatimonadota bacterium]